jgi:Antitoxin ParD
MGRLTIDMTDQQHQSLKAMAALEGKTIRQFALERLLPPMRVGDAGWDDLRAMLRQRIAAGLDGAVSDQSVDQIVEDELQQAGGS